MDDGGKNLNLERRVLDQKTQLLHTDKLHKDHIFDAYNLNKVLLLLSLATRP
jgi:hypothetical protein